MSNITAADLIANPLSKVFKASDWAKLAGEGKITTEDAILLEAMTRIILRDGKPKGLSRNGFARRRREAEIQQWAETTAKRIDALRKLCAAQTAEERAAAIAELGISVENGSEGKRTRLRDMEPDQRDIAVMTATLQGMGYPTNAVGKADFAKVEIGTDGMSLRLTLGGHYRGLCATDDDAIAKCIKIAKASRGDTDVSYTPSDFRSVSRATGYTPNGTYEVIAFTSRGYERLETGLTKEAAEARVTELKEKGRGRKEYTINEEREVQRDYGVSVYDPIEQRAVEITDAPRFETDEECRAYIDEHIDELQEKANAVISQRYRPTDKAKGATHVQVDISRNAIDGKYMVWAAMSRRESSAWGNMRVFASGFESYRDAKRWLELNRENIDKWEADRKEAMRKFAYFAPAEPRRGEDYRGGRDVTEQELGETFGFRGVQFGNWTNQRDRQQSINEAYDALMDMAGVLGLSPQAIGLNGELGLAFGARGSGDANAHYERDNVVINLTKTRGAGSLAHEWWHALDNYFARRGGVKTGMMTTGEGLNLSVRKAMVDAFGALTKAIAGSDYDKRCEQRGGGYWNSMVEESARLFAEWVDRKLGESDRKNSFLSEGVPAAAAEGFRRQQYMLYKAEVDVVNRGIERQNESREEGKKQAKITPMSYEEFRETPRALAGFVYPLDSEIAEEFDAPLRNLFNTIEEVSENGKIALNESAAGYAGRTAGRRAKFASSYETEDGKRVNFTSANPESWGGLFDFDYSKEAEQEAGGSGRSQAGGLRSNEGSQAGGLRSERESQAGQSQAGGLRSERATPGEGLDKAGGEFALVERVFKESGSFNFMSGERIESADDVAYIFSSLEDAAKEHSFMVFVKDGRPTVVELGMGTINATLVDVPTVSLAYSRIKPDEMYFVHNHPSGNLVCSAPDVRILDMIQKLSDVPVHGIIINLKTGHYGTFETDGTTGKGTKREPENAAPLTIHTMDKQIFAPGYNPMERPLVTSPRDVATFLSSQRMGDRSKISFLVLTRANRIIGNIHTPFTEIKDNHDEVARYISERVLQFGGENAIIYGDFPVAMTESSSYRRLKGRMKDMGTQLFDMVKVEGNNTRSAFDEGVLQEPEGEYGEKEMQSQAGGLRSEEGQSQAGGLRSNSQAGGRGSQAGGLRSSEGFAERQRRAVEERGTVTPGLADKSVKVVEVARHDFGSEKPIAEARQWAKDNIVGEHEMTDADGNVVTYNISSRAINKYLSSTAIDKSDNLGAHLSVLKQLPEVIAESIDAEVHPDYNKGEDGARGVENGYSDERLIHRLYGAIKSDGSMYRVKSTLIEYQNQLYKPLPHSYEVTKIELVPEDTNSDLERTQFGYQGQLSVRATKLLQGVEKSYDPGKKLLEETELSQAGGLGSEEGETTRFRVIDEGETPLLSMLNSQPLKKGYRYAQWADMGVRPPMTAKVNGEWRPPMIFSQWEQSEEGMRKANGKADLVQGNGRTTGDVAYNPYFHIRTSPLNDQFTAAYDRPELIVVEGYYPESEETSGYRAEGAKDSVGLMDWHSGSVNGQLSDATKVQTMLSRYFKPSRIVPWSEVADLIMERVGNQDITFPINAVPPMLRAELAKRGARFGGVSGQVAKKDAAMLNELKDRVNAGEHEAGLEKAQEYLDAYDSSEEAKVARAEELSLKLNTPIELVRTPEEIAALPTARHKRAKGWATNRGKIVIVVPNNVNVADIENTAVHEIVGHDGLEAFVGRERMDEFVTKIYDHAAESIRTKIDARAERDMQNDIDRMTREKQEVGEGYVFAKAEATAEAGRKKRSGEYQREATKEYMADMAGEIGDKGFERMSEEELTLWGRIKARVQQFLDAFLRGLKIPKRITLTDKGLAYILYKAWKHKREGGRRDVFAEADEQAMRRKSGYDESPLVEVSVREREALREKAVADKVEALFDEAVSGKLTGRPVEVGKVTPEGKAYLERLSGMKLREDVSFVLNPSDLKHMHQDHYGANEKDKGNNLPLSKEDIRAITKVISNPERVIFGIEPDGLKRKMFYFLSPADDGAYNLLEIYGDRKGNLTAKTFFKTKKAVSQRVLSLVKSEHLTSVTDGASLSDAKLPKFFEYPKLAEEPQYRFRDGGMGLEETITRMYAEAAESQAGGLRSKLDACYRRQSEPLAASDGSSARK